MKFLELAQKRKSCRSYSSKPVERGSIEQCLEAARLAPSACNSQPWHFIVIDSIDLKDKVAQQAFSGIYGMNTFAGEAPVIVAVVRERSKYVAELGGQVRGVKYSMIDVGIACDHFTLQAEEEGLGTCWLGWFNERAVKKILNLPRWMKIDILISLGHPTEDVTKDKNRKHINEMSEFR